MKQTSSSKHNLAWFKLAECVMRGEKERALGVYRLLSHSFSDRAFSYQLEGDIYFSFNDIDTAIKKYTHAAEEYQNDDRLLQAAAVYEHLVTLKPGDLLYRRELVTLYTALKVDTKCKEHGMVLITLLLDAGDCVQAEEYQQRLQSLFSPDESIQMYTQLIAAYHGHKKSEREVKRLIDQAVQKHTHDEYCIQQLLDFLSTLDELYVTYAQVHKK